jgi:hypothetical protein
MGWWPWSNRNSATEAAAAKDGAADGSKQEQPAPSKPDPDTGNRETDLDRAAQFTFGGAVSIGQDVMLGDCSTTSADVLKPCEWRVGPAEVKGVPKYRIWF